MAGRISQVVTEVLRDGSPAGRASQAIVEVLRNGSPSGRASQVVLEVLRSAADDTGGNYDNSVSLAAVASYATNNVLIIESTIEFTTDTTDGLGFELFIDKILDAEAVAGLNFSATFDVTSATSLAGVAAYNSQGNLIQEADVSFTGVAAISFLDGLSSNESTDLEAVAAYDTESSFAYFETIDLESVAAYDTSFDIELLGIQAASAEATLSFDVVGEYSKSLSNILALTHSAICIKVITLSASNTLALSQDVLVGKIIEVEASNSITFTNEAYKTIPVELEQTITFSHTSSGTYKIHNLQASNSLILTQSVQRQAILNRSASNVFLVKQGWEKDLGINSILTPIPPATVVVVRGCTVLLQTPGYDLVLPCPLFGDSQNFSGTINRRQAVDGTVRSYVRNTALQTLSYTFQVGRGKAKETRNFVINNQDTIIRLTNWKGEVWNVVLTTNPTELIAKSMYAEEFEMYQVTLAFEGVKI